MLSKVVKVGFVLMMMSVDTFGQIPQYNYTYPPDEYDADGKLIKESAYAIFKEVLDDPIDRTVELKCGDCVNKLLNKICFPNTDATPTLEEYNCGTRCENHCHWRAFDESYITRTMKNKLETYLLEKWVLNYEKNKTVSKEERVRIVNLYKEKRRLCFFDCNFICKRDEVCGKKCKKTCGKINAGFLSHLSPLLFVITLYTAIF